jgi:hypothetical protein
LPRPRSPRSGSSARSTTGRQLYRLAIDTRDSDVRYEIFALLARAADPRFQGQLFEIAVNHVGVRWALAGAKGKLDDTALDDLGDPISVEQVLSFMRPKKKKR